MHPITLPVFRPIRRPSYGPPPAPHPSGELTCEGCSHCCHYIALEINRPTSKRDYDNIFWYLLHDGVSVYIDFQGHWFVQFDTTCRALTADERCGIYADRPQICREYRIETCVRYSAEPSEEFLFLKPEDLELYLNEKGIDWRWKRRPRSPETSQRP
jgi:hypothetical protein